MPNSLKQKEAAKEKAKQQEFERQKAIVESLTAAGYSKDEIDAYIRSVGWISGGAIKGTENTQRYINQMNQTAQGIKRMSGSSTEYTEKLTTAIKNDLAILYDSGKLSEAEVAYLIKYYGL